MSTDAGCAGDLAHGVLRFASEYVSNCSLDGSNKKKRKKQ